MLGCPWSTTHIIGENDGAVNRYGLSCAQVKDLGFCDYVEDGLRPNGEGDGTSNMLACSKTCGSC